MSNIATCSGEIGDFQGSHQVYDREGKRAVAAATSSCGSRRAVVALLLASTAKSEVVQGR